MIDEIKIFSAGIVRKVHGFRGELMVDLFRSLDGVETGDVLFLKLDGLPVPFWIADLRFVGRGGAILSLDGVNTAEEARRFVDAEICLPDEAEHIAGKGELLSWQAFVGYTIVADGQTVGRVSTVDDSSENILFYIATPEEGREVILPVHPDFVTAHDDVGRTLHLHLPEGLLTLNE